eukprot:TRINITY_DN2008_c0_g1_i1.p1 TRINITY_DN2008_c0_g1~~TRINITY_DN2008_c0_g1_i1.p1  ORF type:complete len:1109 (-),score=360.48 TRINITY_DN2008_c0_g1_i1:710-4036(-)
MSMKTDLLCITRDEILNKFTFEQILKKCKYLERIQPSLQTINWTRKLIEQILQYRTENYTEIIDESIEKQLKISDVVFDFFQKAFSDNKILFEQSLYEFCCALRVFRDHDKLINLFCYFVSDTLSLNEFDFVASISTVILQECKRINSKEHHYLYKDFFDLDFFMLFAQMILGDMCPNDIEKTLGKISNISGEICVIDFIDLCLRIFRGKLNVDLSFSVIEKEDIVEIEKCVDTTNDSTLTHVLLQSAQNVQDSKTIKEGTVSTGDVVNANITKDSDKKEMNLNVQNQADKPYLKAKFDNTLKFNVDGHENDKLVSRSVSLSKDHTKLKVPTRTNVVEDKKDVETQRLFYEYESEIQMLNRIIGRKEEENNDCLKEIQKLKNELDNFEEKHSKLFENYQNIQKYIEKCMKIEKKNEELKIVEQQYKDLKIEHSNIISVNQELSEDVKSFEKEIELLKEKNDKIQNSNEMTLKENNVLNKKNTQLELNLNLAEKNNERLTQYVTELQEKFRNLKNDMEEQQRQVVEKIDDGWSAKMDLLIEEYEQQISALKKSHAIKYRKLARLIENKNKSIEVLSKENYRLTENFKPIQHEFNLAMEKILNLSNEKVEDEIGYLKTQMFYLKDTLIARFRQYFDKFREQLVIEVDKQIDQADKYRRHNNIQMTKIGFLEERIDILDHFIEEQTRIAKQLFIDKENQNDHVLALKKYVASIEEWAPDTIDSKAIEAAKILSVQQISNMLGFRAIAHLGFLQVDLSRKFDEPILKAITEMKIDVYFNIYESCGGDVNDLAYFEPSEVESLFTSPIITLDFRNSKLYTKNFSAIFNTSKCERKVQEFLDNPKYVASSYFVCLFVKKNRIFQEDTSICNCLMDLKNIQSYNERFIKKNYPLECNTVCMQFKLFDGVFYCSSIVDYQPKLPEFIRAVIEEPELTDVLPLEPLFPDLNPLYEKTSMEEAELNLDLLYKPQHNERKDMISYLPLIAVPEPPPPMRKKVLELDLSDLDNEDNDVDNDMYDEFDNDDLEDEERETKEDQENEAFKIDDFAELVEINEITEYDTEYEEETKRNTEEVNSPSIEMEQLIPFEDMNFPFKSPNLANSNSTMTNPEEESII